MPMCRIASSIRSRFEISPEFDPTGGHPAKRVTDRHGIPLIPEKKRTSGAVACEGRSVFREIAYGRELLAATNYAEVSRTRYWSSTRRDIPARPTQPRPQSSSERLRSLAHLTSETPAAVNVLSVRTKLKPRGIRIEDDEKELLQDEPVVA